MDLRKNANFKVFASIAIAIVILTCGTLATVAQSDRSALPEWQFESDKAVMLKEGGKDIISHEGKAEVRIGEYRITTDRIKFTPSDGKVMAQDNVIFSWKDQSIVCKAIEFVHLRDSVRVTLSF